MLSKHSKVLPAHAILEMIEDGNVSNHVFYLKLEPQAEVIIFKLCR